MRIYPALRQPVRRRNYMSVGAKFTLASLGALIWFALSAYLAAPWVEELALWIPRPLAVMVIALIALLPGFMNMFMLFSLLLDRRPPYRPMSDYPGLTLLVAAYNEEASIAQTVESVMRQSYPGRLEMIVVDDGSTDRTLEIVRHIDCPFLRVITIPHAGKARALNTGFENARYELVATFDADTYMYPGALERLVSRLLNDPPHTAAVAGAVLVKNSRASLMTRMQEWDYFHAINSIKRIQSLFQGTLVAQGAFSLFHKDVLRSRGGWPETVGEDIVLTWSLLAAGYRVGFAENAVAFTNAPRNYRTFFRQRRRWARGMIEGFKSHPSVIWKIRYSTMFILWNLMFPLIDLIYLTVFFPGVVAALFGFFLIAGPMTLAVLPLALLNNLVMFRRQRGMFQGEGLSVRRNVTGFATYLLLYQLVMTPACIAGYVAETFGFRPNWGTK